MGEIHALKEALSRETSGEVLFDDASRALYSTDASNYRQVPIGVVIPRTIEDAINTIAICRRHQVPIFSRGAGTSLGGQCCNVAVVVDWTKYINRITELNPALQYARVQPGVICDQLKKEARQYGLTWGPDPATHSHCTFGGMIGNNSCGVHSQFAGKTEENTLELDILLYDGTRMTVGSMNKQELESKLAIHGREGDIYRRLLQLGERYAPLIRERYAPIPRRVSGYNLNQLLPDANGEINLARALVGTESTCVTILGAKVRLVRIPTARVLLVLAYPDVYAAADQVPEIASFHPVGLEGFDDVLTANIQRKKLAEMNYLSLLPRGSGWLLAEFAGETEEEAVLQAQRCMQTMSRTSHAPKMVLYTALSDQRKIWSIREAGLGGNAFVPGEAPTWEGWEDSAVDPARLGPYLRELNVLYQRYGYKTSIYGHFGAGCVHSRVNFDLHTTPGVEQWRSFMEEATDLVVRYGGSLSGEHGDGQARGEFLDKMFGPELVEAFREFKRIWDPDGMMNPGKVVDANRFDDNLRFGPSYQPEKVDTHFHFLKDQGSFAQATSRCVGVGKCRRIEGNEHSDTMCPSFMATRNEEHSTRGRAHLLWEMTEGSVIRDGWKDEKVYSALNLCLSCKGCKSDCPVNVDVATYKAEFLSHYWAGRIRPLQAYAFGWIDKWAKLASHAPQFANLFTQLPGFKQLSKLVLGVPEARTIPAFAPRSFRSWFSKHSTDQRAAGKVLLWTDTFNTYFTPGTAISAVKVLEHAGFQVSLPRKQLCCGRPLYDHGFLQMAKQYLLRILEELKAEIEAGMPMVVLEPSCCSVFRDELIDLLPTHPHAMKLHENTFTLAEFLGRYAPEYSPPALTRDAIIQGHCHQKAIMRLNEDRAMMDKLQLNYRVLESGCCGMAGAFGYEKEKYPVSMACGEKVLLPEVRKAGESTLIMADGFSCREQIQQSTGRRTMHLADVLAMAIDEEAT